jgi:hypothetical protein
VHRKAGTERHRTVSFFEELKRRNVIRVAGLYIVGSWLIVQVATTILPMFEFFATFSATPAGCR